MNEWKFSVSRSLIYFNAWLAIFMLENKIFVYVFEEKKKKNWKDIKM
jgi:hypothetical protein